MNGDGKFITMGFSAEQQYNEEKEEKGEAVDLHLFRNFKMVLQKSKVNHGLLFYRFDKFIHVVYIMLILCKYIQHVHVYE